MPVFQKCLSSSTACKLQIAAVVTCYSGFSPENCCVNMTLKVMSVITETHWPSKLGLRVHISHWVFSLFRSKGPHASLPTFLTLSI